MQGSKLSDGGAGRFYRSLVVEGLEHMRPMVALVDQLASKDFATLPYSTSHDWLCIGSADEHVAVTHFNDGFYEVHYSTWRTQKAAVFRRPDLKEVESRIESLVQRGLMTGEIQGPPALITILVSLWRPWKFVIIAFLSIVLGLPPTLMFSTPTALGYVQLPGVIITFLVACCCVVCFLLCPRRPFAPKLTTLAFAVVPLLATLQLVADYYLHMRYE